MAFGPVRYATFAGAINQDTMPGLMGGLGIISQHNGLQSVHVLFESTGGAVSDGISLYNYFQGYPFDLHLYNAGTVSSIATIAYLGAKNRYVSKTGTFLIHSTTNTFQSPASLAKIQAISTSVQIDDDRSVAILKARASIPEDKWVLHRTGQDAVFTADEAVQCGIAQGIMEWQVPKGESIWNLNTK